MITSQRNSIVSKVQSQAPTIQSHPVAEYSLALRVLIHSIFKTPFKAPVGAADQTSPWSASFTAGVGTNSLYNNGLPDPNILAAALDTFDRDPADNGWSLTGGDPSTAPPPATPLPSTIYLFGTVLLGGLIIAKWRRHRF